MTGKEPLPVYASRYGKKLAPDRYIGFNPVQSTAVPEDANKSKDVFLRGLQSHPKTSMWEMLLRYQYPGMNQNITFTLNLIQSYSIFRQMSIHTSAQRVFTPFYRVYARRSLIWSCRGL
jgi:hypothetical protein